ncbi:endonuclease III domain-containing protein, partial [Flagellimonas flava]|uniref:endonuclease III domain-containing protein n=1 Tax=Flagellimonas flava TaxID=570519 RepID=UPI003D647A9C
QDTDVRLRQITTFLFAKADNAYDMDKLSVDEISEIIKPVGLSPMKSKAIHGLSQILIEKYNGNVPRDMALLEELPAVG